MNAPVDRKEHRPLEPGARRNRVEAAWARLLPKIQKNETGCWEFQGALNSRGYGCIGFGAKGVSILTHRLAYEHERGPIPEGLEIDHLCRNRKCCNPDHLEVVTRHENNVRGESPSSINDKATHCRHGHARLPSLRTRMLLPESGCLRCKQLASRRHQAKLTAASLRKRIAESEDHISYIEHLQRRLDKLLHKIAAVDDELGPEKPKGAA